MSVEVGERTVASAPSPSGDGTDRVEPFAVRPVAAIAAVTVAVMVAGAARYGYHRDELYYLWGGEHLDWGYVDHPPLVPLLARVVDVASGGSLVALRLTAALVVAWLVVAGALIARELGGTRRAQLVAAFAIALTPATRAPEMLFGTTAFDAAVWAALLLVAARLLRTGRTRLWLGFGLVTGIGLETKWSVGVLAGSLVVGFALSNRRDLLRSPHLVAGGALALVLWAPNLWWNATNGWPALEFQRSVADEHGALDQRLLFLPMQLLLTGLVTVVVWGPGLVALLSRRSLGSRFRPLGLAVVIAVAAVFLAGGKPYYVAPLLVVLFAAGGVALDRGSDRRLRGSMVTIAIAAVVGIPLTLPVLPPSDLGLIEPVNPELGEMVGWPDLVATVRAAHGSLTEAERADAIVLTTNYGSAAAIWRDAPEVAVYSGHNSFWFEGPPPATARVVITVGYPTRILEQHCGSVRQVATVTNSAGLENGEHGRPVQVCTDPTAPWSEIWADLRHFE
jgi:4-amino-4-deoxy-L-arabinose transferase-like glycosyltransferase